MQSKRCTSRKMSRTMSYSQMLAACNNVCVTIGPVWDCIANNRVGNEPCTT